MVTSANRFARNARPEQVAPVPFTFTNDHSGKPQAVQVSLGGFEYPGEVIVCDKWQSQFGEALDGLSMFRLVLLQSSAGPSPSDISDIRICVAVQAQSESGSGTPDNRIGEQRSVYNVGGNSGTDKSAVEADIKSIREVRQNYAAISDPQLDRITSALIDFESRANESLVGDSYGLWKSGTLVTATNATPFSATPGQVFLLESPDSWLNVVASNLIEYSRFSTADVSPQKVFSTLQMGHLKTGREQLRLVSGLRLGDPTPTEQIASLLDEHSDELPGQELLNLVIHQFRFPPALATLWIISYVLENDSEIEMLSESGERVFISSDNISEVEFSDLGLESIRTLRAEKSSDWDAVLPFLKLIVPHASSTRYGGGRNSDAEEFNLQLSTVCDRVRATSPVMQSLEIAAGATDRPLTTDDKHLIEVVSAYSWLEYVSHARNVFGSVTALRKSLASAAMRWSAVVSAPDIEAAIYYLDQVEFGRIDHSLSIKRQILRSRFDLNALVENPASWLSLRDEFERWRQDYRRAYLEDHVQKQERNSQLQQRIQSASKQVEQIELLEQVEAVRLGTIDELTELWNETIRSFSVCENYGATIKLIDNPVCPDCRGRLGQPPNHTDVADMISEIERLFIGYRDRLASVVSGLVMDSPNTDKLLSLFRLNSAGDLSDLANVLDDKVISFLNELFGKPTGSSGNIDDWASPHS